MVLILATAIASPAPAPSPDPCGGAHSNLLAALDRPSIGFSACAAKRGEFIGEAGWASTSGSAGFLRYGVAPGLEVDAIPGGALDSGLGLKYEWWHDGTRAFATDLLYTAPTGGAAFTNGAPTETLNFDYSAPIAGKVGFATTLGVESSPFVSFLPSVVIAEQWNPRAQAFVEAYAQSRTRPDGGAQLGMDLSFQYLLAPQWELDAQIGRTANDRTRTHYVGFGLGARL